MTKDNSDDADQAHEQVSDEDSTLIPSAETPSPTHPESTPSVIDRISQAAGGRPKVALRDASVGPDPVLKPLAPGETRDAGKYVVQGELGRGGVGAVHKGHDQDLGRDVAIKFLHEKYRDQPQVLHRFVEEAQIGGQLQHPGIVPVYDLGMADGKPFFAMKLIKGQTLAKLLAERASPATDRRRFLVLFEQVCQTMAYAHARGVVHRDLKPANIMIGSFGEVQVVDWGMGKVLQQGGAADEKRTADLQTQLTLIETVRSTGEGTESVTGSVMGTPAYMPPEQASGKIDLMDERSDVFALGAILCEILTGEPPYPAGKLDEMLRTAALAKLDAAHERLAQCGAEEDLVELTRQCLTPAPAARPSSAAVLAEAIQEHLAVAEQRAHDANVRAAALKRTQKLGIALIAVIAAGFAVSLWFWRAVGEAAAKEKAARGLAEQSARDAKAAEKLAKAAQARAETNLDNFNSLSQVVRLETAKAKEKELYPAWPDKARAMRDWLAGDAKNLSDAVDELRNTLAVLAKKARPPTEAKQAEDAVARRRHPRAAELTKLRRRLAALERAQAVRSGTAQPESFVLDESKLPKTAGELNEFAWPLVGWDRKEFGREAEGLALARRAVSLATDKERAMVTDTLAWALFANGLDDEAVMRSKEALAAAPEDKQNEYESYIEKLESAIAAVAGEKGQAAIDRTVAEVRELAAQIDKPELRFADDADRFLHSTLLDLVADIAAFEKNEVAGVEKRLAWSERVEELTITRYADRWKEARLSILAADGETASTLYAASRFELEPQTGLVPIGMNPKTKLWEFYHLRSAWDPSKGKDPATVKIPKHATDGSLRMRGRGIVFVLIPGGKFFMGAQDRDEGAPNHDAGAHSDEAPVREIELAPYFLSRYELTQGQWARLSGGDYPSHYRVGQDYGSDPEIGDAHPVENVDWTMCDELLTRHGLVLPTEAQWEKGCRGGKSTPWFTGPTPGSLEGFANVLDESGRKAWTGGEPFDDGFTGLARVGTFSANDFGLHEVHGNVWEWCRDRYGSYKVAARQGDGLRKPGPASGLRVSRGGSYRGPARDARSAHRSHMLSSLRGSNLGVRAARWIIP